MADPERSAHSQRFFKTGPGEYAEGDKFLGISVPALRKLSKEYKATSIAAASKLLESKFHEERLLALFILIELYRQADTKGRNSIYSLYLSKSCFVNNWDLVDSSAEHIAGAHLWDKDRKLLYKMAASESLWERRIAVISSFYFIKRHDFADTLNICQILLSDPEGLIHKATGWMLREIGKRNLKAEEDFLKTHCKTMPRMMLRYAIEKFSSDERVKYLKGQSF